MDVQDPINRDDGLPLSTRPKGRKSKSRQTKSPRPLKQMQGPFCDLMDQLKSDDSTISSQVINELRRIGQPQLINLIMGELYKDISSRSKKVREKAYLLVWALAPCAMGIPLPEPTLDDLTKGLLSPDPKIRGRSAEAIADRGKDAKPALGMLQQMLTDPDSDVQYHVAVAIAAITGCLPEKPRTITPSESGQVEKQTTA
jgi:hypothetical protein